ncbi:toxin-antitoxin system YwqK family antitoxin [Campylobacter sp. LR264d]|uniref:toxin-antitoxin system YwqK family antitoxin n=1 Tax=Campylobacter sp. LR264d TaxID=2593544 RepID=UPI00123B4C68|nr:toxin-antitoxin system YwqK family antitoxin [Campylobacter sp. LR264d]KAA6229957.1 toxin-antitoxin system YwqK family antitoxin [Campylobacter sp. LR264d]
MRKNLLLASALALFLVGCGSDIPGQPSGTVRVVESTYQGSSSLGSIIPYNEDYQIYGIKREFYPNGSLKSELSYKAGRPDGISREFYENGHVHEESRYKNGLETGKFVTFYPDDSIQIEGEKLNGNFVGSFKEYYEINSLKTKQILIKMVKKKVN